MKVLLLIIIFLLIFLNTPSLSVFANAIKINEFSSASSPEWIELYNSDNNEINLNGWIILFDDDPITNQRVILSASDVIPSNGYKVIEHSFSSSGWLNNSSDTIVLKDQTGSILDSITYGTGLWIPTPNESGCRSIDGSGIWVICSNPTRGSANQVTLSPTPTPTPTNESTSTSIPTPTISPSIIISNVTSLVSIDQSFDVSVNISNFPGNTNYFLKGAFKKSDGSNYFGQTLVGNTWIKNNEEYAKQLLVTTDSSGNWNGNISIKGDKDDSGFTGNDNYVFKIGYYRDDSSVSWSNEVIVNLTGSVPTPTQTPTSTIKLTVTPTKLPTNKPILTPTKNSQELALNTDVNLPQSILGTTATPSTNISPSLTKTGEGTFSFKNLLFISVGIILVLLGGLVFTFVVKDRFKKI